MSAAKTFVTAKPTKSRRKQQAVIIGQQREAPSFEVASKVAMSIAAPSSAFTPRLATSFTDSKTAVGNPYERDDVNSQSTDTDAICPAGSVFGALYRDPCRAILYNRTVTGSGGSIYSAYGTGGSSIIARTPPTTGWDITVPSLGVAEGFGINYWRNIDGDDPHGPILCCGTPSGDDGDEDRYTWCDANTSVVASIQTPTATTGGLEIETYEWTPEGVRLQNTNAYNTLAGISFTVNLKDPEGTANTGLPAGYYAWRFVAKIAVGSPLTVNSVVRTDLPDSSVVCHKPMPKWEQWFSSAQGVRINGGSITLSNTTPMLERGGQIAAYQAPQGAHWFDYATDLSKVASSQGAAQIDARNGMYTWLSPASEEDLFFLESYEAEDGVLYDTFYPLNPKHQFLVMQLRESPSDGAFFEGFFTFNFGMEFMTDDVSREVAIPDVKKKDYELAFELLKKMPKYAENPTHWQELLASITKGAKDAINWGVKNAPMLINAAELIGKLALI